MWVHSHYIQLEFKDQMLKVGGFISHSTATVLRLEELQIVWTCSGNV